jgi:hypothetical protein
MMYFLDTEFNNFGGEIISLSLVREDGESLYIVYPKPIAEYGSWVKDNVVPILWDIPNPFPGTVVGLTGKDVLTARKEAAFAIYHFLSLQQQLPTIIVDWPDDIAYMCSAITTGPGEMIPLMHLAFQMHRVSAYPTALEGAVQHNAYWDAKALQYHFLGG